ncbi:hypothetical protein HELRODRAFT_180679 [Helobdella robusta]|uniref:Methyltransferase domain-containing protein n=1 Tax=Helobdella robusta TaxID=6412 RepID=T1FG58_HELRO|nr:hypothetical protein HELRODRAFT_180679 [Helobdella robusta]ESN93591.1 hypothetical protein HELRODRAFT_180679 [Helobdella robusta]
MSKNKFVELSFPKALKRYRKRRNESQHLLPIYQQIINDEQLQRLKTARKVVFIGSGSGQFDLEFIERCVPSVEHIVVVECNEILAEEFKKNVLERFGDGLVCTVHKCFIEDWIDTAESSKSKQFDSDLLTMFRCNCSDATEEIIKKMLQEETVDGFGCISVSFYVACVRQSVTSMVQMLQFFIQIASMQRDEKPFHLFG